MLNLELECRLVTQRMEEYRSWAERSRLVRMARTPRAVRRIVQVVRIQRPSALRKEQA
ncbi:MAG TPA: hypothetical protein VE953_25035 [Terriglobales bacterium]|nr:hypothetical protein [Terriglobales bacterium]